VDVINTEADWSAACPSSHLGICVIGFLNAPSDSSAADAHTLDAASLDTLTNVMKVMQKETPVFQFLAGNIACLGDFGSKFGVDPFNTPSIAIYSPSKDRYAPYRGAFTEVCIT
jgi:hypothetical protein